MHPFQKRFVPRNESFTCECCHQSVSALERGGYRNHCPSCLYSKHVDFRYPGDRQSRCHGLMKPVAVEQGRSAQFVLVHRCELCGKVIRNKVAHDDSRETLDAVARAFAENHS
jgi:hypothetical protein